MFKTRINLKKFLTNLIKEKNNRDTNLSVNKI